MAMAGKDGLPMNIGDLLGTCKGPIETKGEGDTLSVCMIVKDEIFNLPAAIKSFLPFADEIIVNDTGSSDGTLEFLVSYAENIPKLKVFSSAKEWRSGFHFGNARNLSLEKSTSKWNIWLDADDIIPPSEVEKLNKLKTAPADRAFGFLVINTEDKQPIGSRFVQCRMFPNNDNIRFERKIHEQSIYSIARQGLNVRYVNCQIYHTGYESKEKQLEKAHRNIKFSLEEPDLNGSPVLMMCLADSYYLVKQWDDGIDWYKKAYNFPDVEKMNIEIYGILPARIAAGYMAKKDFNKALETLKLAKDMDFLGIKAFDAFIEYHYESAQCHEEIGNNEEAIKYYNMVLNNKYLPTSQASPADKMKLYTFGFLYKLLLKAKRIGDVNKLHELKNKMYPKINIDISIDGEVHKIG